MWRFVVNHGRRVTTPGAVVLFALAEGMTGELRVAELAPAVPVERRTLLGSMAGSSFRVRLPPLRAVLRCGIGHAITRFVPQITEMSNLIQRPPYRWFCDSPVLMVGLWPRADWQLSGLVSKKPTSRQRVTGGQVAVARNAGP